MSPLPLAVDIPSLVLRSAEQWWLRLPTVVLALCFLRVSGFRWFSVWTFSFVAGPWIAEGLGTEIVE
jgi:hypothetical protein